MTTAPKNTPNTEYWDQRQSKIVTSAGKWIGGEAVFIRDKSLFDDLFNQVSHIQLFVLNITGRMISKNLARWLENNFMVFSYPDARIWCNQVGALCATMGTSPTAATVAGCLAADSRIYGSQTAYKAMAFLKAALTEFNAGKSIEDIINDVPLKNGKPALLGFVRPVAKDDERIEPHREMTKKLGFDEGPHMLLANKLSEYMMQHYSMGINIGGYTAAFLADQGFSPEELYHIRCLSVANGVTACYVDNLNQPENSFLPLKCTDIEYNGPPPRTL